MRKILIILTIFFIIFTGLSGYGAYRALEIPLFPLAGSPASVGLSYEDVSFRSRNDGLLLKGWYLPGKANSAIIVVHGGFQNRIDANVDTLGLTRDLVNGGFSVLLYDLRGRGESQGKGRTLSNIGPDLGGAVDYLVNRGHNEHKIGVIGFCSGAAATAIFACGEQLGAIVLDGCFARVRDMFKNQANG
jgi:pimeloyl-ACP methyl ester carboxylesterase